MNRIKLQAIVVALVCLMWNSPANATIDTIKGTLVCFLGCNKNVVQSVAQGQRHAFEVVGQFVDLSTGVQVTGSGVSVSYGTRKGGSRSSIIVHVNVQPNAAPGERTVKMRYAIETNGPDTFKIKVLNRGTVSRIQYRRPLPFRPGGPASEIVAPVNLPLNERIVLIVTGTRLANVQVKPHSTFRNVRLLPGASETQATIEVEFSQSGQGPLLLYDSTLSAHELNTSTISQFLYGGSANLTIQYGSAPNPGGTVGPPRVAIGGGGSNAFIDVAPRANMINVFRRQNPGPAFSENGRQFFAIDSQRYCNDMTGNQSRIITIPNPVWGVSNVGTAPITNVFASQLRSGTQILTTETITTLNPGETIDFTFARPNNSKVRVSTFLNRIGCFISPTSDAYFEDPPFTVTVNTNGTVVEAVANQANNSRNY